MTEDSWKLVGAAVAILGVLTPTLLYILRNVGDLRERVTRLETQFEWSGHLSKPQIWRPGVPDEPPTRRTRARLEN